MRINIFFVINTFSVKNFEPDVVLLAMLGAPMLQNLTQVFADGANIQQQWGDLLVSDAKSLRGRYIKLNIV